MEQSEGQIFNMKKYALMAAVVLAGLTTEAQVQRKPAVKDTTQSGAIAEKPGKMGHHNNRKGMMKELNLTKEQKATLKYGHEKAKAEKMAIQGDSTLSPAARKEKMKQLKMERKKTLDAVLTPEQKEKMKALQQEKRKEHPGKAHHKPQDNQPAPQKATAGSTTE